jgi:selenide,water dikinase
MSDKLYCRSGGCTAKLGAGALSKVLSQLEKKPDENLLVGFDSHDDGAVYKINDEQALITTLDFFPPLVEDPYTFGAIAATNAMSDVYAMGGKVLTALNIVCFPENMDLNILGKIMEGGNAKVLEAGAALCGGHSIADTDVKYGLSVTGLVHPDRIAHNNTPKAGDVLYLSKPLGTGLVLAANRINQADPNSVKQAIDSMLTLNKLASEIAVKNNVHAMSDVTGFGLMVHLSEMLDGKVRAVLDLEKIPTFKNTAYYAQEFYITAAGQRNRNYIQDKVQFLEDDYISQEIVYDPQTSGGLLMAFDQENAKVFEEEMNAVNAPFWQIGRIEELPENEAWIIAERKVKHV